MDKDEQIKQLKQELDYYKKNSVMICGMSSDDDDDKERAEELDVKETVKVEYAMMYGDSRDRRCYTDEIEAVIDSTGTMWVDAEYFYNNLG